MTSRQISMGMDVGDRLIFQVSVRVSVWLLMWALGEAG